VPVTVVTAPTGEPITLAYACAHLRINQGEDDLLVEGWIQAAREYVERYCQRTLLATVYDLTMDGFPYSEVTRQSVGFPVPRGPVSAVASVKYYATTTGTDTTLSTSDYYLSMAEPVARIWPAYGVAWPAIQPRPGGVRVRYTAGYTNAAAVPQAIKQAMLLLIGDMSENREAQVVGGSMAQNATVDRLLWPYRLPEG
jgi:uncharacterized phiE125 gp8 family phage protein